MPFIQVNKKHYTFTKYFNKKRWFSLWHQLDEIFSKAPSSVLEIGPGPGTLKALATHLGVQVHTVDIDFALDPTYVAQAAHLPFRSDSYGCVCAFQVLEHMPYEQSLDAFSEMVRVSNQYILISLPDAKKLWTYSFHIPKFGPIHLSIPRPRLKSQIHYFEGQHYWEVNKEGYDLKRILRDLASRRVTLLNTYQVFENPYHRFFIFRKHCL